MTTNEKAILGTEMFEILRDKVASRQGSLQDMMDAAATLAATVVNEATRITEAPLKAVRDDALQTFYFFCSRTKNRQYIEMLNNYPDEL